VVDTYEAACQTILYRYIVHWCQQEYADLYPLPTQAIMAMAMVVILATVVTDLVCLRVILGLSVKVVML
jgi:hypothetical protein